MYAFCLNRYSNGSGGHSDSVVFVFAMVVFESGGCRALFGISCNMEGFGGRERACESVCRVETR